MKIAILSDIHVGPPLMLGLALRAASHRSEEMLPQVLEQIVKQHAPDLIINFGDLVRSESSHLDAQRYSSTLQVFQRSNCPVLHLVGNHELKRMSIYQLKELWQAHGYFQEPYGVMQLGGVQLVWLGLETDPRCHKSHKLPQEQYDWLKALLATTNTPTLIFTHCAIDDQDLSGNFFYETFDARQKQAFFLQNHKQIRELFTPAVKAVFQAHLHYFHAKTLRGVTYITCPAMGDNLCAPDVHETMPEIYTLVTFDEGRLTAKAFSRQYCFAGTEVSFLPL